MSTCGAVCVSHSTTSPERGSGKSWVVWGSKKDLAGCVSWSNCRPCCRKVWGSGEVWKRVKKVMARPTLRQQNLSPGSQVMGFQIRSWNRHFLLEIFRQVRAGLPSYRQAAFLSNLHQEAKGPWTSLVVISLESSGSRAADPWFWTKIAHTPRQLSHHAT